MIAYLSMMLESGTLHCDPHPDNLLRTADGQLCILDWGLVSTIDSGLQLTLIEHVAHLTAKDYGQVPSDLVKLGFVPEGSEQVVRNNGVVDFLTYTYSTWSSGGGAAKLDMPGLFSRVRELASDTSDGLFQVPPYFAYIAKSSSVLEGIGLSIDEDYSIVSETLPYISQRIIIDPSPRTAGALQTFVFGQDKEDESRRVVDPERTKTLLDGAKRYMDAMGEKQAMDVEVAAELLLDTLVAEETPLQGLLLEQLALVLAATTRDQFAQLREASGRLGGGGGGGRARSALGLVVDPLGLFRDSPLVINDERDEAALEAARKLATQLLLGGPRRLIILRGRSQCSVQTRAKCLGYRWNNPACLYIMQLCGSAATWMFVHGVVSIHTKPETWCTNKWHRSPYKKERGRGARGGKGEGRGMRREREYRSSRERERVSPRSSKAAGRALFLSKRREPDRLPPGAVRASCTRQPCRCGRSPRQNR